MIIQFLMQIVQPCLEQQEYKSANQCHCEVQSMYFIIQNQQTLCVKEDQSQTQANHHDDSSQSDPQFSIDWLTDQFINLRSGSSHTQTQFLPYNLVMGSSCEFANLNLKDEDDTSLQIGFGQLGVTIMLSNQCKIDYDDKDNSVIQWQQFDSQQLYPKIEGYELFVSLNGDNKLTSGQKYR